MMDVSITQQGFCFEMVLVGKGCWIFLCDLFLSLVCFESIIEWLDAKAEMMIKEHIKRIENHMMFKLA